MKFTIQVLLEATDALPLTVPIQTTERPCESIEEVGLQTTEAKGDPERTAGTRYPSSALRISGRQKILPALPEIAWNQGLPPAAIPKRIQGVAYLSCRK